MTMRKTGSVWWPCAQTMFNLGNYQTWGKVSKKKNSNTADYFIGIHWEMELCSFELVALGEEG